MGWAGRADIQRGCLEIMPLEEQLKEGELLVLEGSMTAKDSRGTDPVGQASGKVCRV